MTKRRIRSLLGLLVFLCLSLAAAELGAQSVPVYGIVTNAVGRPVPGVTVSLFHPTFGRSYPSMTDVSGRYIQYNIPVHPTAYFIEVYWGNQLIYRAQIPVRGPTQWNIQIR